MSKHHHHPHEGHSSGNPPKAKHNWFFYVAGIFILIALLAFIFSGDLVFNPSATPPPPAPGGTAK